jgi:DNA polymerase-3 subunit delta
MEHLRILRDIELKNFKPIYFLMGEESYFIDVVTEYIENNVLDEASKAFGQTIVYGRDVSMEQVMSLAKSFPMMGDKQVVIVKEAQDMKEWKSRKKDAEETEFKSK